MGRKNAVTKRYYSDKTRFADLINGVYFRGNEIIHPNDLTENSEVYAEPSGTNSENTSRDYLERTRDIKMRHQSGTSIRILTIENQHYVDYSMPFRNMQYDVLEYQQQLEEIRKRNKTEGDFATTGEYLCKIKKTDRLHPVYTICLYLGEEPWDGPHSLKDMMDFGEDTNGMSNLFADYPFRLYCVNEQQESEEYNMCQAIKELIEDGRQEGLSQGRQETLKQNVESLMSSLSIPLAKACELLGRTEDYEVLSQMLQK